MKPNYINDFNQNVVFPKGYGRFPYIIIKAGYALFIQIPIHFNVENNDVENFPGTHVNGIDEKLIKIYAYDKFSPLHDILIEHCRLIKSKIEADKGQPVRLCLVEGENEAHYFEANSDFPSTSIPLGGTLITQAHGVIGLVSDHFIR